MNKYAVLYKGRLLLLQECIKQLCACTKISKPPIKSYLVWTFCKIKKYRWSVDVQD